MRAKDEPIPSLFSIANLQITKKIYRCPCRFIPDGDFSKGFPKDSCKPFFRDGKCRPDLHIYDCRDGYSTPTQTTSTTTTLDICITCPCKLILSEEPLREECTQFADKVR